MNATEVEPYVRLTPFLPGHAFADAYCIAGVPTHIDARAAAHAVFSTPPKWVRTLMALRNRVVARLGLIAVEEKSPVTKNDRIGNFPVVAESAQEILLGFDDRHLDFRIAVTLTPSSVTPRQMTVTTLVRTHNRLGRVYLRAVLPFHRLIVRRMLERGARSWLR